MTHRIGLWILIILVLVSVAAFVVVVRQMSSVSVGLAAHEQIDDALRMALEDQKRLAVREPALADHYHDRFTSIANLRGHLRVLELNRRESARQIEQILLVGVILVLTSGFAVYLLERRNREGRLVRLEAALNALSRGEGEIVLGERRSDVIGRIAAAVERSSKAAAQDRARLRYLEHLSSWQEAARRHAHEMRTPLTAARMDVDRVLETVRDRVPALAPELDTARGSILRELDKLGEFTRNFTSFATIPRPQPQRMDLVRLIVEFCTLFDKAWPGVRLVAADVEPGAAEAMVDAAMLQQVLANLATNSALAIPEGCTGTMRFHVWTEGERAFVDVADDGTGIPSEIRSRLFEPYTTSRRIGEGMGLGLAISKKIMLDHGGDLDLLVSNERGTTFRLTFMTTGSRA